MSLPWTGGGGGLDPLPPHCRLAQTNPRGGGSHMPKKVNFFLSCLAPIFLEILTISPPPKVQNAIFGRFWEAKFSSCHFALDQKSSILAPLVKKGGVPLPTPSLTGGGEPPTCPFIEQRGLPAWYSRQHRILSPRGSSLLSAICFTCCGGQQQFFFFFWQTFGYSPVNGQTVAQQLPSLFPCCLNCHPC